MNKIEKIISKIESLDEEKEGILKSLNFEFEYVKHTKDASGETMSEKTIRISSYIDDDSWIINHDGARTYLPKEAFLAFSNFITDLLKE